MKKVIALVSFLVLGLSQVALAGPAVLGNPLESLAKKAIENDVRTVTVGSVEVTAEQANQCTPAGVYEIVELQIQKTTGVVKGKNGKDQIVRSWVTVNSYRVNAAKVGVPFSGARLSDAPCVK